MNQQIWKHHGYISFPWKDPLQAKAVPHPCSGLDAKKHVLDTVSVFNERKKNTRLRRNGDLSWYCYLHCRHE